jgi:hypothetical protein
MPFKVLWSGVACILRLFGDIVTPFFQLILQLLCLIKVVLVTPLVSIINVLILIKDSLIVFASHSRDVY